MADYRRFVAYIYEYTNGRKNKNTGFTKVESRNDICKLQVHLQNIPQGEESINIYGVVREAAWLLGIFLGRVSVEGSTAEIQITTPSSGIGDTEYTLDQISGLWIKGLHGGLYITIWDDEPVDIKRFVLELPTRPGSKPETSKTASKSEGQDSAINNESSESQNEQLVEGEELAQNNTTEQNSDVEKEDVAEPEAILDQVDDLEQDEKKLSDQNGDMEKESITKQESVIEQKTNPEEESNIEQEVRAGEDSNTGQEMKAEEESNIEQEVRAEEESNIEQEVRVEEKSNIEQKVWTGEEGIQEQESNTKREEILELKSISEGSNITGQESYAKKESGSAQSGVNQKISKNRIEEDKNDMGMQEAIACPFSNNDCNHPCNRTTSIDRRWQCLSEQYTHMSPFADDEIVDCIKIAPKDLTVLRQNTWRLGRNSFLMHGYYNYNHILLGKCRTGGYIIAVPGVYENQESFMASMFGFPHFKKAREQDRTGRFGYWYRPIE